MCAYTYKQVQHPIPPLTSNNTLVKNNQNDQVLEASWTALQAAIAKAPDLDALVQAHDAYLKRIADTAFLGPDKARLHAALQAVRVSWMLCSCLCFSLPGTSPKEILIHTCTPPQNDKTLN